MYFRQILHADLGCASYLVADAGEAAVIDPKWEIGEYLEAAADAGAEIRYVFETHHHADHVSGRRRLAAVTRAAVHVPDSRPDRGVHDGEVVRVGELEVVALASPGHRPEHVAYAVRERGEIRLLLAGDSLLVGDVARPDLAVDATEGAEAMWLTLQRLMALGDNVELWPAHVGGSLCASRAASSATSSTIGQERRSNPLLLFGDSAAFIAELTRRSPARPPNVERVVSLNAEGAAEPGPVRVLDTGALVRSLDEGACVLDIRDPRTSTPATSMARSTSPPAVAESGTRAGWASCAEEPIVLVSSSIEIGHRGAELLRAAGMWNLAGLSVADPSAWKGAGLVVRAARALPSDRALPLIRDRASRWSTFAIPPSGAKDTSRARTRCRSPSSATDATERWRSSRRWPRYARAAFGPRWPRASCGAAGINRSGGSPAASTGSRGSARLWSAGGQ